MEIAKVWNERNWLGNEVFNRERRTRRIDKGIYGKDEREAGGSFRGIGKNRDTLKPVYGTSGQQREGREYLLGERYIQTKPRAGNEVIPLADKRDNHGKLLEQLPKKLKRGDKVVLELELVEMMEGISGSVWKGLPERSYPSNRSEFKGFDWKLHDRREDPWITRRKYSAELAEDWIRSSEDGPGTICVPMFYRGNDVDRIAAKIDTATAQTIQAPHIAGISIWKSANIL